MNGMEVSVRLSELPANAVLLLMGDEDRPVVKVLGEEGLRVLKGDELVPLELPPGFAPSLNLTTERTWWEAAAFAAGAQEIASA
jgi:hypothetical protein